MTDERVVIGTQVAIRLLIWIAVIYLLYLLRSVVLLVLFSLLTAAALAPAIAKLRKWHFSRTAAVIIIYAIVFLGGVTLLAILLPLFFTEMKTFLEDWPQYAQHLDIFLSRTQMYLHPLGIEFQKEEFFQGIEAGITGGNIGIFSTTIELFQGFIHFIGFFFLALYLSIEEKGIEKFFLLLTPAEYHTQALSLASRMQGKVSQWLFGQMLLMVIAFFVYAVGLTILGIPYALAIAVFGGFMEILPYIGPVLAAIPAILAGMMISPILGVTVFIFYIIAHQLEAHIIAPQVMKRSAGLNPVALILAILIGLELGGPVGIILAVPITMILSVFVDDILEKKQF
ncbi:MAG: AI-2E family transporter [Minisyncoccota bacterium]